MWDDIQRALTIEAGYEGWVELSVMDFVWFDLISKSKTVACGNQRRANEGDLQGLGLQMNEFKECES